MVHLIKQDVLRFLCRRKKTRPHCRRPARADAFQAIECHSPSDVVTEGLLIEVLSTTVSLWSAPDGCQDPEYIENKDFIYHLDAEKDGKWRKSGIFQQIGKTIQLSHIYKMEMICSLVHTCLLFYL